MIMSSLDSKKNGTIKEEGELTDDDEEENNIVRRYKYAHLSSESRRGSRYISAEQIKNYELGEKFGSKRRDSRRRIEVDNRRSSRNATSGGARKHHREHQDIRQTAEIESYTPSKFWVNRRFRASSVRPLSPRDERQSGPRRTDSPQRHRGHDGSGEGQDELERLEQEQKRIREQLKSLEEEELNSRRNEHDCALDQLETRSEAGDDLISAFSGSADSAGFNYLLEAEKSEDEDIDVQELRRLALATSERHIRLMASEPQPSQPGVLSSDVVVIPDMEPDSPDPVVVMVDEEEDLDKNQNQRRSSAAAEISLAESLPAKTKHRKSGKLKKKERPVTADQMDSQDQIRVDVKSKVTVPSSKKSKGKKRKKGDAKKVQEWNRQRDELKILVMDNPTKALEKLLKFASEWEGSKKPIVTGTIKDFKRQKQIPVLSDKRAVQNFSQQSVGKKSVAQEKLKEVKDHDKKSGHLQDNYEEVEMDIDSNAEDEEIDDLLFGEDVNQAMLPVSFYRNIDAEDLHQSMLHSMAVSTVTPSHFITPPVIHFDGMLQPPIPLAVPPQPPLPPPLPPPPPPPPPPPTTTYEQEWNGKLAFMQERQIEVMDRRIVVGRNEPSNLIYCDSAIPVSNEQSEQPHDAVYAPVVGTHSIVQLNRSESGFSDFVDLNSSLQNSVSSLDDDIGRRLRMIRQNQDNKTADLQDLNVHIVFPSVSNQRYVSDSYDRAASQHPVAASDNSNSSEDVMTTDQRTELYSSSSEHVMTADQTTELYSSVLTRTVSKYLPDESFYKHRALIHSPSVLGHRSQMENTDTYSTYDFPSEVDEYVNLTPRHRGPLLQNNSDLLCVKPVRTVFQDRSPSPSGRHAPDYARSHRDGSSSAHSSPYSRRPIIQSHSKHSSPQTSVSREYLRDHFNDKASASSEYLSQNTLHEASHHRLSSPHEHAHRRRTSSSEKNDVYEPEVPPTKKFKRLSPPPYIPTSIRPARTMRNSHMPKLDDLHISDSEEEDPIALRNKLLAEVIEKRKTLAEGLSSNTTTPSGMSPRQDSTHSESFDTFCKVDEQDELSVKYPEGFKSSIILHRVSEEEEEDDAEIKPPPVINRRARQHLIPPTLVELCKREVTFREDNGSSQQEHLEFKDNIQPVLRNLDTEYLNMDQTFEEDSEGLSNSDLQVLRDFILRVQRHGKERQQSLAKDTQSDNKGPEEMLCSATTAASSSTVLQTEKSDFVINVSSSSWDDSYMNSSEDAQISSGKSLLGATLKPSVRTSGDSDTEPAPNTDLISSCHVTSSMPFDIAVQSPLLVGSIKAAKSTSLIVCSEIKSALMFPEAAALSHSSPKSPEHSSGSCVPTTSKTLSSLINESKAVFQYPSATSLTQGLQLMSSSTAENMKPVTRESQSSIGSHTSEDIFPEPVPNRQNSQPTSHLGPGSKREEHFKNVSEIQISSAAASMAVQPSNDVSIENPTADSQFSTVKTTQLTIQQSHPVQLTVSDLSTTLSSFSDRPSLSYSSHVYTSFGPSVSRKYLNVHMLPVHPKVLVPMNSSSDSDGDSNEENESHTSHSTLTARGQKNNLHTLVTSQGVLSEMQDNKKAATQLLQKQEQLLSVQEQAIQKDQKTVKLLVRRAVKFLEAQQQEEEKRQLLRKQLLSLSQEMKKAEKLVMMFKVEKEKTEKQVQLVTERLLQKKKQYEKTAKSVISLGSKLLGPSYIPRINKPHVTRPQELATQEKQNLSRAQHIAQEKLKLIEKEKQIAEKLRKLKEAQVEKDTGKSTLVKHVPDVFKSTQPKWKCQDVIRIDKDAKPDISIKQRRKSLLDMNSSTTPNIPLTPHRSQSLSNADKENVSEAILEVKQTDTDECVDLSSVFKMPSGTQLANFCKLQREKTQKYLQNPNPSPVTGVCSYTSLMGWQKSTAMSKMRLHSTERTQRHVHSDTVSYVKACHFYRSPLLMFRSYRFNSYFRTKENLSLQSSTYSHKINPNSILCPYDLQGTCNDDSCKQLHPRDYKLSDHELLEEIVSYCPKLTGAADGASPEQVHKCIVTFVDNILSRHKTKMTIDDLCLWLLSQVNEASGKRHPHAVSLQPRVWKPHPKEELGLSLDLDQKLTSHGVETLNMDRRVSDKDSIVSEEDVRYFTADVTEMLSLEADIMENQTDVKLWQKLARKKLSDPNKFPKECLDQALSVLARGLEVNRNNPDLWYHYLALYKRHPDVKDFPEFCQTALEYAPSYELWFLYLESLKIYSEKDKVSTEAFRFLCNIAREKGTVPLKPKARRASEADVLENYSEVVSEMNYTTDVIDKKNCQVVVSYDNDTDKTASEEKSSETSDLKQDGMNKKVNENPKHPNGLIELGISTVAVEKPENTSSSHDHKQVSHQALEMILYKTCLNLHTGRIKTALHFLQDMLMSRAMKEQIDYLVLPLYQRVNQWIEMVLRLKKQDSTTRTVTELLTAADLLVLWMSYIYVLEWHQLPQHIYSMANQNPGRLLAKENISLPWTMKTSLYSTVDHLVKLHHKAARVWENSPRDEETTLYYVKLIESQVSLLKSQNRHAEAVATCRSVLSDKKLVDIWLAIADLYASFDDKETVKRVFSEALSANIYSSKLQFYQCVFLYQQGEAEVALRYLQQFAVAHCDVSSGSVAHWDSCQLYSQLLKQEEAFSLHMALVKEGVADDVHKDVYMWLCYSLLLELQGKTEDTVEVFERSLTHSQTPDDLVLVWQNYIAYLARSGSPLKEIRETVMRSLISVPTKFSIPFSPLSSAMWVDYYHSNRLMEAWLTVLSPEDTLDFMEMCLSFMPNNVQLLLRAVELSLAQKMTRRAYSWCQFVAAHTNRPANLAFWKMATALAQVEGTPREVENMLVCCVETMPLAVSGWKDLLLFEVTRENAAAVNKLLTYCQQLQLNIEGFVSTLSAP